MIDEFVIDLLLIVILIVKKGVNCGVFFKIKTTQFVFENALRKSIIYIIQMTQKKC